MDRELIGIAAGIFTSASLLPQLIKSLREKKVNVSLFVFLLLLAGNGLWVVYGIGLKDAPIIVTNCFAFAMDVAMLTLKFIFDRKTSASAG